MKNWMFLLTAIAAETIAISALKASDGFRKLSPSLLVVAGYGTSFYFLSLALRAFPTGVAYAIWSGIGLLLVTLIGWLFAGQRIDMPGAIGMTLILAGIMVMNLFSKTVPH